MTRKRERTRRTLCWAGVVGATLVLATAAWLLLPTSWQWVALMLPVLGLVVGHRYMIAPPGIAVLTYHSVSPDPRWLPWSREIAVHPTTFERHLSVLRRMGVQIVGSRAMTERRHAGAPVTPGQVVLHFDDGYLDNFRFAAPLLRAFEAPATFFASLDFVDPGSGLRGEGPVDGYMNWDELAAIEAQPEFEVEPHGVAHARVPISEHVVGRVEAANWRAHAWLQWDATPGTKYDWYRRDLPSEVPVGSPIPMSGLALAERGFRDGVRESVQMLHDRIAGDLSLCRATFEQRLGISPRLFCWPENKLCAEARVIARDLGYRATTGGRGRNTADEPADTISRIHVNDRALGFRWLPAEALYLRAAVRLMQGNHYWYLLLAPMQVVRRMVFALRRRFGADFA
ncbi:Peptidoglycan/xylan/chitin deacetylase, PgdA/CDA1 family [Sphingomonas palmae]|uniref:Chitooligosaccharide deacetylase n=1 Tax=Sphingomonas palmae TaxID=1855283 RepID=A0A1H7U5L1_9SPHN|nr:polysaccharide deacetylase family protein [Sphingomonas palmae]SEL91537.1 Peptidoglycan/xylan/chitin deacetylase, PgdA/CDA1 family [Sphingomonas palmae]